jgi:cell division septation protein DedD
MKRTHLKMLMVLILSLSAFIGISNAQEGVLNYGDTVTNQIDANAPQALYSFSGNTAEVVTIYALSWSEAFQPSLTVLGPTGQVAFNNNDALTPMAGDARVSVVLPQTGSYSVLVGSGNGAFGEYTLALRLTTPGISTALSDAPVTLTIPPGGQAQAFSISSNANTSVQIASLTGGFGIAGYISAPDGHILVAFDGALPSINVALPADEASEPYILVIFGADATQTGDVSIQLGSASSTPSPQATSDNTSQASVPADQCAAVAGVNGVNVRSGPGTGYNVIATLAPNDYLIVTGQNNGWYSGSINGSTGWVAGSVITLTGPCSNLPFVDVSAPAPTDSPSSEPTSTAPTDAAPTEVGPTATQPTVVGPTATTPAPTATTPAPTATTPAPTEPAAQIAPPDNQLNLTIDRDSGGQLTDAVSYPDGDTSDRVRVTISNLTNFSPNSTRDVTLTLVCTGSGTENISWGTGGPSSPTPNGCGQSISVFHGFDSNQTFVNINMSGPGYVNWTLVATPSS